MRQKVFILALCFLALCAGAGPRAQETASEPIDPPKVSYSTLHNEHYEASLKERSLARRLLQEGSYDESALHAAESERLSGLSDEYIARKLLEARTQRSIAAAEDRIAWAKRNEAEVYYPKELAAAAAHYGAALEAQTADDLNAALENALAVAADLADVAAPPGGKPPPDLPPHPNKYKVRPWDKFGDCFWNIAKWFYKNPWQWRVLFEANKDKIPDPDNPDLIEVGTVIDIPNRGNESRDGFYDTGLPYPR
ncbi:MAG: LysM peptidoglycan-binding domain-containing protein [Spirochaetaceae bacterium]|jgi:nucleoid-associated protein YgaU|nr:LysM peptidoglycan-binding domain-containing protein [Spirochaetaceae bacterium]